ncbi:hypothetical protein VKS41_002696 [Umbelopsis sp. WA50703]
MLHCTMQRKLSCTVLIYLFLAHTISFAYGRPLLILTEDSRGIIPIASFGFLAGGELKLEVSDFKLSQPSETGNVAFYIRKSSSEDATYLLDEEVSDTDVEDSFKCLLDANFVRDEIADGLSIVFDLDPTKTEQSYEHTIQPGEEDLWAVYLINCKASTLSMTLNTTEINPGPNYLSAGDSPLPTVYGLSSVASFIAAVLWGYVLLKTRDYRVFKSHYLMLALMAFVGIDKAFQSAKYHYMKIGVVAEGWTIGFYIFTFIKGSLSILIIVLVASGWMFIKPFLSTKDKRIISIIVPIQVLANIASVFASEAAIGSINWSFWTNLLPVADLAGCGVVLWTILQTRKHLGQGSEADGKELDVLRKYKLWSTFYIVTLAYLYVTRIIVGLLQVSLPFRYVNWLGEAVSEAATLLFYIFIGYKFRPHSDNPYTQVPTDEEEDYEQDLPTSLEAHSLQHISRRGESSNHSN